MRKVFAQVSVALLVAACSTEYPVTLESPTVQLPATGHHNGDVTADGDGYFVVTLGGVPLILTAGFVPG
jgi:hypothetical protein